MKYASKQTRMTNITLTYCSAGLAPVLDAFGVEHGIALLARIRLVAPTRSRSTQGTILLAREPLKHVRSALGLVLQQFGRQHHLGRARRSRPAPHKAAVRAARRAATAAAVGPSQVAVAAAAAAAAIAAMDGGSGGARTT